MAAPFRVRPLPRPAAPAAAERELGAPASTGVADYADRLQKLVPAEVISLYLAGTGVLGADPLTEPTLTTVWAAVCLAGVVAIRVWGTRDPTAATPAAQWPAVAIAAVSFVIWVYQLGGPFVVAGVHDAKAGALMLLAWTFFVPLFYRGDTQP